MAQPDWLFEFPALSRDALRTLRKSIDDGYREFSRAWGDSIEAFFDPLLQFMIWFERFLLDLPWWMVIVVAVGLAWAASRKLALAAAVVVAFMAIGLFGMWEDTMRTIAIIAVCTLMAIVLGIPIGIVMAR